MRILLLGGSNVGRKPGWGRAFELDAKARGWSVENRYLGMVGSAYAVIALQRLDHTGDPWPDRIVIEYMLNDILLANARMISPRFVYDALAEITDICARRRVGLTLLGLEPRHTKTPSAIGPTARVRAAYREQCKQGVDVAFFEDLLLRPPGSMDYFDDNHFTLETSQAIARGFAEYLDYNQSIPSPAACVRTGQFVYCGAQEAELSGNVRLLETPTPVFCAMAAHMERASKIEFKATGRLCGLLLCADSRAGEYIFGARSWRRRKMAATTVLELLPRFTTLHYPTHTPPLTNRTMIAMPEQPIKPDDLRADPTHHEQAAQVNFSDQRLIVYGALFWRGPSGARKILEAIERCARAFWRFRRRRFTAQNR